MHGVHAWGGHGGGVPELRLLNTVYMVAEL